MRLEFARCLAALLTFGPLLGACEPGPLAPGTPPDMSLASIDGAVIDFAELRGRPVLLSFWSTSCKSCLEEIPQLIALHRDLADRGLTLIGISMPHDRPDRVVALSRRLQIPYPLVFDPIGTLNRAFDTGQVTPTHLLISPDGEIVSRHQGRLDFERLKRAIKTMLQG